MVIQVDGIPMYIDFSVHGKRRLHQRHLIEDVVYSMIQQAGERLLDAKPRQEIMIQDPDAYTTVYVALIMDGSDWIVKVITVINDGCKRPKPHQLYIRL
jgi:hypothetical protein